MALLLTALTLLSSALAQTGAQVTWSAVTFTYHGEKTPSLVGSSYHLTPLGAQQLYTAGQLIRARYVDPSINATGLFLSPATINGLETSIIDNSQLYVLATDDEFIAGSALAFLQGVYPPVGFVIYDETEMANLTAIEGPLNGYQYPNVESVSANDFDYIWVAGNLECSTQSIINAETLSSAAYLQKEADTSLYYQSLTSSVFEALDPTIVGYQNAWELYEYALYAYTHNSTLFHSTAFTSDDLSQLYNLASQQQWEYNTPNNGTIVNAISGRTLASKVIQQFMHTIDSDGVADKLTMMFGSFEPFLAFFALSNLATGPSASRFNTLPLHGSTMTFELFSYPTAVPEGNLTTEFPPVSDLYIRFMFRNGTASDEELVSYPLFGHGPSEVDMRWDEFVIGMGAFSLDDVGDWCNECQTITLFCEAIESNTNSSSSTTKHSSSGNHFNPVIGGVIGAAVTIALLILGLAVLMLFGFRMEYHPRSKRTEAIGGLGVLKRNGSGGQGGFKGAEKLASDTDLALKGAGATVVRHERVGSWELNDGAKGTNHSSLDKEIGATRADGEAWGRKSEDEEGVNPFGDPIKPRESV